MKKILFAIIIVLTITSCKSILKVAYGIKEPKQESRESLIEYLDSKKLKSENVLLIENEKDYDEIFKRFGGIPEAILFDSEGNALIYKEKDQDCNAGLFSIIPNLNATTSLKKSDHGNLSEFMNLFTDLAGQKIREIPKYDFYLFINWAKFAGKLNKDHTKVWEQLANDNTSANIKVYKVNMDLRIGWKMKSIE